MSIKKVALGGWIFYLDTENEPALHTPSVGKWMYFFDKNGATFADEICREAVETGVAAEAKHTDDALVAIKSTGVCCFYCDGSDKIAQEKIIAFFLKNHMIRRTNTNKLYNIYFKFDAQTLAGEYQDGFKANIKLSDFLDLTTGEWLPSVVD